MGELDSVFQQQKSALQSQIDSAVASLNSQKAAAEADIQSSYNQQSQLLASEVEKSSQALLSSQLQPIVVNAEQKSPLPYMVIAAIIVYYLLKGKK